MKKMKEPLVGLLVLVGLSGCATRFNPETDASSPLAPRVQALVDAHRTYPRWADFPKASQDLPTDTAIAANVTGLNGAGQSLTGQVGAIDWQNTDPAALEAEINRRIDASKLAPVTARTAAEVEAFAESLRSRAKAPPPIPHR